MSTLPISDLVTVNVNIAGPGLSPQSFGTPLLLGASARLPPSDRIRYYASLPAVANDFQTSDPEYIGAQIWFAKTDVAPPPLAIGRRWTTAVAGALFGAVFSTAQQASLLASLAGATNIGFDVTIDGTVRKVATVNLSAQTTMAGIATQLQTALAALAVGTTCTWSGARFVITSPTTGLSSSVSTATVATGSGTPVDYSTILKLTAASGAYGSTGAAAETTAAISLAAIQGLSSQWYAAHLTSDASDADRTSAAGWCVSNNSIFLHTEQAAAAYGGSDTSTITYLRWVAEVNNAPVQQNVGATFAIFSTKSAYAALGAWANQAVVQWGNRNSTITLNLKPIAGLAGEDLSLTQKQNLLAHNCNAYVNYGSPASFVAVITPGICSSGRYADEIVGLAWFQNTLQTDLFNFELTQPKIPQTNEGVASLEAVIVGSCEKGVNNGLFAPGAWTGPQLTATSGDVVSAGDILQAGYKVLVDTVESQSAASKVARANPPIQVAAKGANAIQNIAITATFAR